jgi:hypothetical protein
MSKRLPALRQIKGLLAAVTLCVATAWGQSAQRQPHIGYLYPAGGQQGAVSLITVGGQLLQGANQVSVSGAGVRAKVIQYYRPVRNIMAEQRQELMARLNEVRQKRLAELPGQGRALTLPEKRFDKPFPAKKFGQKNGGNPNAPAKNAAAKRSGATSQTASAKTAPAKAPFRPVEHPLLYGLENKSLRELGHITYQLFFPREKRQQNVQIDEMVLIEVTVAPDATPGDRELRLEAQAGLTNPMVFQVGQLAEIRELEPNEPNSAQAQFALFNPKAATRNPKAAIGNPQPAIQKPPPLDLPVLLNGQIMPGDVDRFSFRARKGQRLVMEGSARRLVPYLADAVPGWFQPVLALYDAKGKEIAFADDYRFNPDPVLFYEIPQDGEYELEIRDSIYRGREDFVYRIAVSEQPFITAMYPLGGQSGVKTVASAAGWNLTKTELPLDTQPGPDNIRHTALHQDKWLSNEVTYAVDTLPECNETEPNNDAKKGQRITLPQIINGRIAQPGDVDMFRFEGRAGDQVVAEVYARRLNSPLDSLVRLTDASGKVLAWNDDHEDTEGDLRTETGLLTHSADSYLCTRLPKNGLYCVSLTDSENHGGEAYGYRLRIAPPQPDFALRVTPSSLNVPALRNVPLAVHALRKDGFDGDIELVLKDAPEGFTLNGGRIPKGCDHVRLTLAVTGQRFEGPVALHLEGRATIGGKTVSRPAVPSEDMMQAFLYRHLVPSRALLVAARKTQYSMPPVELAGGSPVRIPTSGTAQVQVRTPKVPMFRNLKLELSDPPKGVTLRDVTATPDGLTFVLKAEGGAAKVGLADNLIVEAFTESAVGQKGVKAPPKQLQGQRFPVGVLPAIPFEIVQR